jgi:hypothetical protein
MTSKPLSEALEEAFIQSCDMDASLAERLQAFAAAGPIASRYGVDLRSAFHQRPRSGFDLGVKSCLAARGRSKPKVFLKPQPSPLKRNKEKVHVADQPA